MSLQIIPFEPRYASHFRELNVNWLEKYFHIEPKDVILLDSCEKAIIDKGGHIFFASYKDEIIGCFSFIKLNESVYELGKMAVEEKFQGLKIGQQLLFFAIDFAKENHWKKVVLYSSTKLDAALHIYRKYGFKEVVLEQDNPYNRSDIKMELVIDAN